MENRAITCVIWYVITVAAIMVLVYSHCYAVNRVDRLENDVQEIAKIIFGGNPQRSFDFDKKTTKILQKVAQEEPNFALQSIGASIAHTEDEPFNGVHYLSSIFGFKYSSNNPENVLDPSMQLGNCYAFKGDKSSFTIKLFQKIFIRAITLEHIHESVSLTGDISNAPKDFLVYGIENLENKLETLLGSFQYDNKKTKRAQTFNVQSSQSFQYCKIKIVSNHGNSNHTCIYRVAVHGRAHM